ncbi:MAG: hypothetical protein RMN25_03340 [Anaerolineae bacterium]|nr:hypothetical protein [Thermoflexales bacterium]MDW8406793.1 hypothetical protein [Anaerolineae bacterium]
MVGQLSFRVIAVALSAALLAGCSLSQNAAPRIELPQQVRLPQNDLAALLERRSGRIAIVDDDGNVVITDQTGRSTVTITREGNAGAANASSGPYVTTYNWPMWSPDGRRLALIEVVAQRPAVSAVIEYGVDEIIVRRGRESRTIIVGAQGQLASSAPNTQYRVTQPNRVVIEPATGSANLVYNALYVTDADGKSPLIEVHASEDNWIRYLNWSPDGSRLAFVSEDIRTGQVSLNVDSVEPPNQPARRLFNGASAAWHWSPDGATLLARVRLTPTSTLPVLSMFDVAGNGRPTILSSGSVLAFFSPQLSPDGQRILTTIDEGNRSYLAVMDRQGKLIRRLTEFQGAVSFAWSPAEERVAYITRQSPQQSGGVLRLVDVNSGEDKVLTDQPVIGFFWAPDGRRIAAFSPMQPSDITPDLPGIDYTSSQPGTVLMLHTIDVNTRNARQIAYFEPTEEFLSLITQFDVFSRSMNIWSPDSTKLVFPLQVTTRQGPLDVIFQTEASGSITPRFIGLGALAFWSPK